MSFNDIVELVAPVHKDKSIAYLVSTISENRNRFHELFPNKDLITKHHFLEHYPQ